MNLASLFAINGVSGAQVARRLRNGFGVIDPVLFERIDQRRQPLPSILVRPIATILGVAAADVSSAARRILIVEPFNRSALLPRPARLGDPLRSPPAIAPLSSATVLA
jgi:hypothetical protein